MNQNSKRNYDSFFSDTKITLSLFIYFLFFRYTLTVVNERSPVYPG